MNDQKIQRFLPAEIFLHWVNAILYLLLFCTGIVILLYRILEIQIISYETASGIHRKTGITLIGVLCLTFILSLFMKGFRQFWRTLRQCLTWNLSDIVWLIRVPLNMLFKQVVLPPANRFNAGQKMHLLVIIVVLLGFSISGVTLICAPGILVAWVIHLICFIPAALFLVLHLFLSLINPSTRKTLPSIFTGYVSTEYACMHHPLWLEMQETTSHHAYVSKPAVVSTATVLIGLILLLLFFSDRKKIQISIQNLIAQRGTTLILPGLLSESHTNDVNLEKCSTCHQHFLTPASDTCICCHEMIQNRKVSQTGYHGTLTGACISCHPEHLGRDADIRNFDTTQFDHDLANFKLTDRHIDVDCQNCHFINETNRVRYIGLSYQKCTDCHTDPHQGGLRQACNSCHSEKGWKGSNLLFSHDSDTDFKIDQIHSNLKCDSCHKDINPPLFKPLPVMCKKCHTDIEQMMHGHTRKIQSKPDPHAGRVACIQCHLTDKYQQTADEYANQCKSCHTESYEQLFYDWDQVFKKYPSQVNKIQTELRANNIFITIDVSERIKEAEKTGFHNIHLANELWNQILSDTLILNE